MSPRPLSRSRSHRHTSTLATTFCADLTATANSMEQALQEWRDSYQIQEEAYTQLHSLLQSFGIPIESTHSADGSHGNSILPESSMVDPSLFSADPSDSGTTNNSYSNKALSSQVELGTSTLKRGSPTEGISASPFESAITAQGYPHQGPSVFLPKLRITNEGLSDKGHGVGIFHMSTSSEGSSNKSPTIWQNSNTSVCTGGLDFAFTNNMFSTESFQQVNSITSDRLSNTTAEGPESAALSGSQSIPESLSRPRPCIRCWKRKLRVYPVSLFEWNLVDQ